MRTYKDAKVMAKSLRDSLTARSVLLSHSQCLEIVAKQLGFADWNTLSGKSGMEAGHSARREGSENALPPALAAGPAGMSRPAESEQLSCSFCDRSQHEVRSLVEGGCRRRGMSPCVFICDECVALCAEVNADLVGISSGPQDPSKP
jgi:hypothetical protein